MASTTLSGERNSLQGGNIEWDPTLYNLLETMEATSRPQTGEIEQGWFDPIKNVHGTNMVQSLPRLEGPAGSPTKGNGRIHTSRNNSACGTSVEIAGSKTVVRDSRGNRYRVHPQDVINILRKEGGEYIVTPEEMNRHDCPIVSLFKRETMGQPPLSNSIPLNPDKGLELM
ncbi:hypothetical protein FA13DRAFT_1717283 [Coprinellus micaceus]|uniref:Uncharacterized protein n=1 Tax=Coprinellus micaceus TaxID=71717 RepID=A0A4Y7SH88_COPMI|nr:hypothetical protein FA13DRAFT_1717283 [Coprinellus micaceus]